MTIEEIYNAYYRQLCYFAERIIKDHGQAEDIVSNTFVKFWQRYHGTDEKTKTLLYTMVKNACFDYTIARRKDILTTQDVSLIEAREEEQEDLAERSRMGAELVSSIMERAEHLPYKCKTVFMLTYVKGLPTAEISKQMGISKQNVLNQKQRALQLLRICVIKTDQKNSKGKPWYKSRIVILLYFAY